MRERRLTLWHGFLFAVVVLAAIVLGIARLFKDDAQVPTADVPSVSWEEVSEEPASEYEEESLEETLPNSSQPAPEDAVAEIPEESTEDDDSLPVTMNLAVPFTSQAPFGVWDAVHEETCEEASILMVTEYFDGNNAATLSPQTADGVMLDMVAFEEDRGYGVSVSAAELEEIIVEYYDGEFSVKIIDHPTIDELRSLIAEGYPVIVPAAGRELGNPFFTGEGPLYHMLVIRGYTETGFVTNDPGTRHGENYFYPFNVFMDAIADWNNGDPTHGTPRAVVMRPEGE